MGRSARLVAYGFVCIALAVTTAAARENLQFTSLSASETLTCGVVASGSLYCWGSDRRGLIGEDDKDTSLPVPAPIAPELRFQSVSVGDSIICGVATSRRAYCWGSAVAARKPEVVSQSLTFRSVSSGLMSACGVTADGAVYCWGLRYSHSNDVAEFHNNVPVRIKSGAAFDVVSSSTSAVVGCGVAKDGAGYCWGDVLEEQEKHSVDGANFAAVPVKAGKSYRSVSAGRNGAIAIGRDGISYEWPYETLEPRPLEISVRLASVDARGAFLCATDAAGAGYCWGDDTAYLGSGSRGKDSGPQQLFGNLSFSLMTVAQYHACGLTTEGRAYCWGHGASLGNALSGNWSIPTPVANTSATPAAKDPAEVFEGFRSELADVDQIEKRLAAQRELNSKRLVVMIEARSGDQLVGSGAGLLFFAGLDRAYVVTAYHLIRPEQKQPLSIKVRFWEKQQSVEAKVTGDWDRSLDLVVLRVDGIERLGLDLFSMPFGQVRRSALERGESLRHLGNPGGRTWGSNVTPDRFLEERRPVAYFESSSIRPGVSGGALLDERRELVGMIRADESGEGQALVWDAIEDRLRDWGYPVHLGMAPVAPPFVSTAVLGDLNYGVTADHAVYSWPELRADPGISMTQINGLKFSFIGSKWSTGLCGLDADGQAHCWTAPYVEPGNQVLDVPEKVAGDTRFRSLAVGDLVCGLTSDDQVFCWSRSDTALGDGSVRRSSTPVAVHGSRRFKSIASGPSHSCGLDREGALYCWGKNDYGKLGQPPGMSFDVPTLVPGKLRFKAVSCGPGSTCAISEEGVAYCWGYNEYGQLGDGTEVSSATPVAVKAPTRFKSISVGSYYACAVAADGGGFCWGINGYGQLGNGTLKNSSVPVEITGGLRFASLTAGYTRTIGNTTSGAAYTWGMQIAVSRDTDGKWTTVPRPAPSESDWASVEPVFAYRMDGDYENAERAAEKALQKYPDSKRVVYEVARLMADVGKFDRTRVGIQRLREQGEDRVGLLRIATLELLIGAFDSMFKDLDRAEKLSKSEDEIRGVQMQRAHSQTEMGQLAAANSKYKKILSAHPEDTFAMNNLAYNLAEENGSLQAAYDLASAAVALNPDNGYELDTLGFICNRMSRFSEARGHLERALANEGTNDPDILEHLGDTYSKLGDSSGARAVWRGALQKREAEAPKRRKSEVEERLRMKIASESK